MIIAFEKYIDDMKLLELKIPPLILMAFFAILMWLSHQYLPLIFIDSAIAMSLMMFFIILGAVIIFTGALAFRKAKTTVNPTKPETTSSLVNVGIFKVTRNPMYLGMASGLLGWACYLSNPTVLIFILLFILYMNRFQIKPEEEMLTQLFGQEYTQYCTEVRRWI